MISFASRFALAMALSLISLTLRAAISARPPPPGRGSTWRARSRDSFRQALPSVEGGWLPAPGHGPSSLTMVCSLFEISSSSLSRVCSLLSRMSTLRSSCCSLPWSLVSSSRRAFFEDSISRSRGSRSRRHSSRTSSATVFFNAAASSRAWEMVSSASAFASWRRPRPSLATRNQPPASPSIRKVAAAVMVMMSDIGCALFLADFHRVRRIPQSALFVTPPRCPSARSKRVRREVRLEILLFVASYSARSPINSFASVTPASTTLLRAGLCGSSSTMCDSLSFTSCAAARICSAVASPSPAKVYFLPNISTTTSSPDRSDISVLRRGDMTAVFARAPVLVALTAPGEGASPTGSNEASAAQRGRQSCSARWGYCRQRAGNSLQL